MSHLITFVDDDALPEGHDFVFVQLGEGAHIFYRESAITERVLEDSWAAYRAIAPSGPPVEPARATMEDWAEWDSGLEPGWFLYVA